MDVREPSTGVTSDSDDRVHDECRECSHNRSRTAGACPVCGGAVAAYEFRAESDASVDEPGSRRGQDFDVHRFGLAVVLFVQRLRPRHH
jgi:hypothetical protein